MLSTRREMIVGTAGLLASPFVSRADQPRPSPRLGLVIHSFPIHSSAAPDRPGRPGFADPIHFLNHCHSLGARCIQVGIGICEAGYTDELRKQAEATSIQLEGIVGLPLNPSELARFEAEVESAKRSGATILRTVCLSGRRYETFHSSEDFREFAKNSEQALRRAAPVAARHGVQLAVENHKDWRSDELVEMLHRIGSETLGVCLDTGNSIALLEDPNEVVTTLAPFALTTHFKDMSVQEYRDGFLLAEVPFGKGILDLRRMLSLLIRSKPEIHINIEMITRDPLAIPCLKDSFWATFEKLPGLALARSLAFVRGRGASQPLPKPSTLILERRLQLERENVQECIRYARNQLTL